MPGDNLWRCPVCDRPFANRNQSHSCGRYTVADFLKGKSKTAVAIFKRFSEMVNSCGSIIVAPAKTRVGFQVRMIFAAVNKLDNRGLRAHVILARRYDHPRFTKIESLSPGNHVHHFAIKNIEELDNEVQEWLREAYKVGRQEHLSKRQN